MNVDRALDFLEFCRERHFIWEQRQDGMPQPWTPDPVLATRKFTNVFRVLDPGSQFVIREFVPESYDLKTYLMRCFLYRHTNLPSAWLQFKSFHAGYPWTLECMEELREFWKWGEGKVFSGAYMIYPQSSTPGTNKIDSVIDLTIKLFLDNDITTDFLNMETQEARFAVLRRNKGVADFMSMQILTDFGYATEFREDEFVVPGPGARKGAAALEMTGEDAIEWAYRALSEDIYTAPLFQGRTPSRMDAQNCLCEFSKWVRLTPGKVPYAPAHPGVQAAPLLPPMWKEPDVPQPHVQHRRRGAP